MAGINKVILIGNLGSDPEIRYLPSGAKVANFNIATSETYTNREGEKTTQTEWHRLELWDRLAEIAEKYLSKGSTIYVEGKLKTDSWQDNDGVQRSTTKIRVLSLQMLDKKGDTSPSDYSSQPSRSSTSSNEPVDVSTDGGEDDLPF